MGSLENLHEVARPLGYVVPAPHHKARLRP